MLNALILGIFIIFQVADGVLTWYGINHTALGIRYEANPILVPLLQKLGTVETLIFSKTIGIAFGILLYIFGEHRAFKLKATYYLYALTFIMVVTLVGHMGLFKLLKVI